MRGFGLAVLILAACGGGLPTLPGAGGSGLSMKITASEDPSVALAGATGFVEYVDGTTELTTADGNGKLTFSSLSVANGVTSISVAAPGRVMKSIAAPVLSRWQTSGLSLRLLDPTPTPNAKISGTVKNKAAATDTVELSTTLYAFSGEIYVSSTYDFLLVQGAPFTIVGLDIAASGATGRNSTLTAAKWFHIDHDPLSGDESFDIDVRAQAADSVTTVTNKIVLPDPTGPFGSTCSGGVVVYSQDPTKRALTPVVGMATLVSLSSDKTFFAFSVDYVTILDGPLITDAYLYAQDGSFSSVLVEGAPSADRPIDGLRTPLTVSVNAVKAGDTLDATGAVDPVSFSVRDSKDNRVWDIELDQGTDLRIPILADDLKTMFAGAGPLQGVLETCARVPATDPVLGGFCRARTKSPYVDVTP